MSELLFKSRWFAIMAVFCLFMNAIVMLFAGIYKSFKATQVIMNNSYIEGVHWSDISIKYVIQSIDAFLLAIILGVFALGIFNLFITPLSDKFVRLAGIANIKSIGHLKLLLAEVIIIILFVHFLRSVIITSPNLTWSHLVLPIAIIMLSGGLKLLGLGKEHH